VDVLLLLLLLLLLMMRGIQNGGTTSDDSWLRSIGSCQILYCKEYDAASLIVNSDEQQQQFNPR